jgi:transcription termination factor Rho
LGEGEERVTARPRKRGRRGGGGGGPQQEAAAPSVTRPELEGKTVAELKVMATEIGIDVKPLKKKDELIDAVLEAKVKSEGFIEISGILDVLPEGYGFIRTSGYLPGDHDVYVSMSMIRRNELRRGDMIVGQVRPPKDNEKYPALQRIDSVNNMPTETSRGRARFADLTPVYPDERLRMEHGPQFMTARTIDMVAPIGKGQRGLIVSPPKAGKTTVLKDIAAAISANNPEVHLMCLLVDERPEEVTDMERSIHGEVVSSTFDMPADNHIAVSELVMERAKRLVESGRDVVILLDSITRLARAYNLAQPASGRILSGGVDSQALYPPKKFFGAARNIENGGSLTILATALVETGSKMDEVIFEEFKGTGNMELRLDRGLADRRIFPAIDVITSGTRKEELILDPQEAPFVWGVRRILHGIDNPERAIDMLIKGLKQTQSNLEFLAKMARKANEKGNGIDL